MDVEGIAPRETVPVVLVHAAACLHRVDLARPALVDPDVLPSVPPVQLRVTPDAADVLGLGLRARERESQARDMDMSSDGKANVSIFG